MQDWPESRQVGGVSVDHVTDPEGRLVWHEKENYRTSSSGCHVT